MLPGIASASLVAQDHLLAGHIDSDRGILPDRTGEDRRRQLVDQFPLHQPLDRTRTVSGIVSLLRHIVLEGRSKGQCNTVLGELGLEFPF